MLLVLAQLLFSTALHEPTTHVPRDWREVAVHQLTEVFKKYPAPQDQTGLAKYKEEWEIFMVATETTEMFSDVPDPEEFLRLLLAKMEQRTAHIASWIRQFVDEELPLTAEINDGKLSCNDLLKAFFAGKSLVSCAKVDAHGARQAHEIINYIHDIFHTISFYQSRIALMQWIHEQTYAASCCITRTMAEFRNAYLGCCACCSTPPEEELAMAQKGIERYKQIMEFLQRLALNDPQALTALFWTLHEVNVWKPSDFDEEDKPRLLETWKKRVIHELNEPDSWQKKHKAPDFGFIVKFRWNEKEKVKRWEAAKKQLRECNIEPTDELLGDYDFWKEVSVNFLRVRKTQELLADQTDIQAEFNLSTPLNRQQLVALKNLAYELSQSTNQQR